MFPSYCALCGGNFIKAYEIKNGICGQCEGILKLSEEPKCNVCGKPLVSEINTCLPCRKREENGNKSSYNRLWTLYPYTGKYRKLLAAYKFKKNLSLANILAKKVMEIIAENPVLKEAVIVPVPPRPGKIKETGWDQVNHLIKKLKGLSKFYSINKCLKRKRSKIQKQLTRTERMENLKGRIYLNGTAPKIALIIDDVITTGSTMEVCSQVLKENGTETVYGICLFYD
ncbi:MAG: ComF family protein [Treponema sp.]|nr:ComF family protein [Treponema sp.]